MDLVKLIVPSALAEKILSKPIWQLTYPDDQSKHSIDSQDYWVPVPEKNRFSFAGSVDSVVNGYEAFAFVWGSKPPYETQLFTIRSVAMLWVQKQSKIWMNNLKELDSWDVHNE